MLFNPDLPIPPEVSVYLTKTTFSYLTGLDSSESSLALKRWAELDSGVALQDGQAPCFSRLLDNNVPGKPAFMPSIIFAFKAPEISPDTPTGAEGRFILPDMTGRRLIAPGCVEMPPEVEFFCRNIRRYQIINYDQLDRLHFKSDGMPQAWFKAAVDPFLEKLDFSAEKIELVWRQPWFREQWLAGMRFQLLGYAKHAVPSPSALRAEAREYYSLLISLANCVYYVNVQDFRREEVTAFLDVDDQVRLIIEQKDAEEAVLLPPLAREVGMARSLAYLKEAGLLSPEPGILGAQLLSAALNYYLISSSLEANSPLYRGAVSGRSSIFYPGIQIWCWRSLSISTCLERLECVALLGWFQKESLEHAHLSIIEETIHDLLSRFCHDPLVSAEDFRNMQVNLSQSWKAIERYLFDLSQIGGMRANHEAAALSYDLLSSPSVFQAVFERKSQKLIKAYQRYLPSMHFLSNADDAGYRVRLRPYALLCACLLRVIPTGVRSRYQSEYVGLLRNIASESRAHIFREIEMQIFQMSLWLCHYLPDEEKEKWLKAAIYTAWRVPVRSNVVGKYEWLEESLGAEEISDLASTIADCRYLVAVLPENSGVAIELTVPEQQRIKQSSVAWLLYEDQFRQLEKTSGLMLALGGAEPEKFSQAICAIGISHRMLCQFYQEGQVEQAKCALLRFQQAYILFNSLDGGSAPEAQPPDYSHIGTERISTTFRALLELAVFLAHPLRAPLTEAELPPDNHAIIQVNRILLAPGPLRSDDSEVLRLLYPEVRSELGFASSHLQSALVLAGNLERTAEAAAAEMPEAGAVAGGGDMGV